MRSIFRVTSFCLIVSIQRASNGFQPGSFSTRHIIHSISNIHLYTRQISPHSPLIHNTPSTSHLTTQPSTEPLYNPPIFSLASSTSLEALTLNPLRATIHDQFNPIQLLDLLSRWTYLSSSSRQPQSETVTGWPRIR